MQVNSVQQAKQSAEHNSLLRLKKAFYIQKEYTLAIQSGYNRIIHELNEDQERLEGQFLWIKKKTEQIKIKCQPQTEKIEEIEQKKDLL